jgi:hypothetical protein
MTPEANVKNMYLSMLAVSICIGPATGNDGFYQGSGSSMIPVKNKSLRVVTEHLSITPIDKEVSYSLLVDGKRIGPTYKGQPKTKAMYAHIGPVVNSKHDLSEVFTPRWHAHVEYEIEALEEQKAVVMGFPIPLWVGDFLDNKERQSIQVPSAVNFRTYIDGILVRNIEFRWINGISSFQNYENVNEKTLAYIWKASFKKGKRYLLKTEYDFGVDYSAEFFSGHQYIEGETPWFVQRDRNGHQDSINRAQRAVTLKYYLTPLTLWADAPPSLVAIKVEMPLNIPVTCTVPMSPKPCFIDQHALYYEFKNSFPNRELMISFPASEDWKTTSLGAIKDISEWKLWQKTLGDHAKLSCPLTQEFRDSIQSADIREELKKIDCVQHFEW